MKFALINEQRQEAQPGLLGSCLACGHPTVAKCGKVKIWHWAHKVNCTCDPWWENETEWHRAWKGHFPVDWQEVVQQDTNGEKHIADVKTDRGWVVEFQHSYIKPEERQSRDAFYPKLIWVVDASRRKRDGVSFLNALKQGTPVGTFPNLRRALTDKSGLLREWAGSPAPVFFDFGPGPSLWWLLGRGADTAVYVAPFSRVELIQLLQSGGTQGAIDFDAFAKDVNEMVVAYEARLRR